MRTIASEIYPDHLNHDHHFQFDHPVYIGLLAYHDQTLYSDCYIHLKYGQLQVRYKDID